MRWRRGVIIARVPIGDPLLDIAGHIQHAVETGAGWIVTGWCGVPDRQVIVEQKRRSVGIPPRIGPRIGAPRRFLPLRLRRQAPPDPGCIGDGLVPIDIGYRVFVKLWIIPPLIVRRLANGGFHTASILRVGNFALHDPEIIDRDRMDRFFIGLAGF